MDAPPDHEGQEDDEERFHAGRCEQRPAYPAHGADRMATGRDRYLGRRLQRVWPAGGAWIFGHRIRLRALAR